MCISFELATEMETYDDDDAILSQLLDALENENPSVLSPGNLKMFLNYFASCIIEFIMRYVLYVISGFFVLIFIHLLVSD